MTSKEIIEGLKLLEDNMVYFDELLNDKGEYIDVHELLFEAIEVLEQEPCEDYISRTQAIKAMDELENEDIEAYGCSIPEGFDGERARQAICLLPSIQPKPKTECSCDQIKWERDTAIAQLKELGYGLGEKPKPGWIPLKTRPMTEEETTFYRDWVEYGAEIFDCPLPDDGQEVLISWGGTVCIDTFIKDDSDGCYFEGVDIDDVDAWQPLPEPYKAESEDEE